MSPVTHTMELRLNSLQQLFNSLDPSPFMERDLDADAEAFILGWAQELPRSGEFRLVIHVKEFPCEPNRVTQTADAIRNYFNLRTQATLREFRQMMHYGRLTLVIGLVFLALCLLTARYLGEVAGDQALIVFLSESLMIGGWVAMWRPMETFLYDWWPLVQRRGVLARLARAEVEIRAD